MLAQLAWTVRRVETEDAHAARVARTVALEDLGRGRLARSVRSEQAEHLTDRDREAHTTKCLERTPPLAKVRALDRIHRRPDSTSSSLLELFTKEPSDSTATTLAPWTNRDRKSTRLNSSHLG